MPLHFSSPSYATENVLQYVLETKILQYTGIPIILHSPRNNCEVDFEILPMTLNLKNDLLVIFVLLHLCTLSNTEEEQQWCCG